MDHEEFTWKGALMVFWALTWRFFVILFPVAILIGLIFGAVSFFMGVEKDVAVARAGILGQIAAIPVYILVIKRLFSKGFGKYRLAVLEK